MKIILTALVRLKNNEHGGVKRSVAEIVDDQVGTTAVGPVTGRIL